MFVELQIALPIIVIGNLVGGFIIGKYHERFAWNKKMASKNITPENWSNIPYQHGG